LWGNIQTLDFLAPPMSDGSVNVESRTSSQDKRWTIMAALLGTNTAVMLFQGMEQESNPKMRENKFSLFPYFLYFPCNRR